MDREVAEVLLVGLWLQSGSCWDDGPLMAGQIQGT